MLSHLFIEGNFANFAAYCIPSSFSRMAGGI